MAEPLRQIEADIRQVDGSLPNAPAHHTERMAASPEALEIGFGELDEIEPRVQVRSHSLIHGDYPRQQSQVAREFYAAFLGEGARFQAHPASKQSIFALVSAGFGITFATASHAETGFAGVVFKRIDDPGAMVEMSLAWLPELEDPVVGRFVAFLRDEMRSRRLAGEGSSAAELGEGAVRRHEAH